MNFIAIDFETATSYRNSACAVGIVTVEKSIITDKFYSLIQPPFNDYFDTNIRIHGIQPFQTKKAPTFAEIFPEIQKRIENKKVVAHNKTFDQSVLDQSAQYYDIDASILNIVWDCTMTIYKAKGYKPYNLAACCLKGGIALNHHEALSDAEACAKLYLNHLVS
ncbi:MAG: DNA polymerase III subunit epsilon [Candidatus Margulisbacteria bacterium GWF2_35_9]|nr:MAG: DNA polymerase III subunit epsilon [Candidatus Margulisbacteria bacterium GWF2_35_9]